MPDWARSPSFHGERAFFSYTKGHEEIEAHEDWLDNKFSAFFFVHFDRFVPFVVHASKKTVSRSPCSTMSNSYSPGRDWRAISVLRRSAGTSWRIGSAALSGSFSK